MKPTLEFANFTLRFGNQVMLDFIEEIVLPAFLTTEIRRTHFDTEYFLHETRVVPISVEGITYTCIIGQLVKDMQIKRQQVYEQGTLKQAPGSIRSSPSATFVLLLENHKLLYLRELPDAPGIVAFRNTILKFIRAEYQKYIRRLYVEARKTEQPKSWQELGKEIPRPELTIIPLSTNRSSTDYIGLYAVLQSVEIKAIRTNHEINTDEFFRKNHDNSENLGAKSAAIRYSSPEGLNKEEASKLIGAAAKEGNAEIITVGKSRDGDELRGTNQEISYKVGLSGIPSSIYETAVLMVFRFFALVIDKTLSIGKSVELDENKKSILQKVRDKK